MVDNFDLIKNLIVAFIYEIDKEDYYYHLQIIKRNKDTGEGANSVCLKAYQIDKAHPLEKYKDDIISLCEKFKARAYINISPKSKKATAVQMLNSIADCFRQNNFQYLNRIWNTAAGQVGAIKRYWIVDCDYSETFTDEDVSKITDFIDSQCPPLDKVKYIAYVPTKNGKHIITTPFDLRKLKEVCPNIDVHKNNPTVLYIPKSLDNGN